MADVQNGKNDDGAQSKHEPFNVSTATPRKALDEQPKRRSPLLRVCPFILGAELCERLAYYSISTNLVQYLSDKLGYSLVDANTTVTNWSGACYIFPLLGAFIADSYLGRYTTIIVFSTIYTIGLLGVTLAAGVPALQDGSHVNRMSFYLGFLYLIALGTGGIKPCVSSFGADQFDDQKEAKEKSSFFNFFYWMINIGALIASLFVVNLQTHVSWAWGYAVPTIAFGAALLLFFAGTRLYKFVPPGGSALWRMLQVVTAACVKCGVKPPKDPEDLYEEHRCAVVGSRKMEHSNQLQCLDKAATRRSGKQAGAADEKWLYTVTQVEEVKRMLGFLPIMIATIMFNTVYAQMSTVFVEQGLTMDLSMGPNFSITSASLSAFDTIAIILLVPIYDRILIPILRRWNLAPTYLQRVGIGLGISTMSMVVAAIVEAVRLKEVARLDMYNSTAPVPISVFWLIPQYFIIGAAEIMVNIGTLEMFYSEAPDAMRSLASALQLLTNALGNFLATAVTIIITDVTTRNGGPGWLPDNLNRGRLDLYYLVLVIMSVLNVFFFIYVAKAYKYKKVKFTDNDPEDVRVDAPTVGLERFSLQRFSLPMDGRASGGHGPRPHNQTQPTNPPCYAPVADDMDNDLEREQKAKLGKGSASRGLKRGSGTRSSDLKRDSLGMYRLP